MTMIDGATYRLIALRSALRLEIQTGMKATRHGSPLKVAQQMGLTTARRKEAALRDVDDFVTANLGLPSFFHPQEGHLMTISEAKEVNGE